MAMEDPRGGARYRSGQGFLPWLRKFPQGLVGELASHKL